MLLPCRNRLTGGSVSPCCFSTEVFDMAGRSGDEVGRIIASWRRERPDVDVASIGIIPPHGARPARGCGPRAARRDFADVMAGDEALLMGLDPPDRHALERLLRHWLEPVEPGGPTDASAEGL